MATPRKRPEEMAAKCGSLLKGEDPTDPDAKRCGNPAGYRTDHLGYGYCKFHGGNSPAMKTHAARIYVREKVAAMANLFDGLEDDAAARDPASVLLLEVARAARVVAWLDQLVSSYLTDEEMHESGELSTERAKQVLLEASKEGARSAEFVKLWTDQRKVLARHAQMAIQAGLKEREVHLAEEQGRQIVAILRRVINDPELGLSREQLARAAEAAQRELRAFGSGTIPATAREALPVESANSADGPD